MFVRRVNPYVIDVRYLPIVYIFPVCDMNAETTDDINSNLQDIVSHIAELRARVIRTALFFLAAFLLCYTFSELLYRLLLTPLEASFDDPSQRKLIYTGLTEAFFTYMKTAYYGAVCLTAPFGMMQIYLFVAPGLYAHEKKMFCPITVGFPFLFLLGASLAYYAVMPLAYRFFLGFESPSDGVGAGITLEARVSEYLALSAQLIFAFGMVFQFPLLMAGAVLSGAVPLEKLRNFRKYAIVAALITAALLTPPDIVSQVMLAIPIIVFYEITLFACGISEKRKAAKCNS